MNQIFAGRAGVNTNLLKEAALSSKRVIIIPNTNMPWC